MWWPSPLFGGESTAPIARGARDLPGWYYVGLVLVVGGCWLTAYLLAIRAARLTGRAGIPAVAVGLNIGWELNDSLIVNHSSWQRPFNFAWFLLDLLIARQVLRYGPLDYPELSTAAFRRCFGALVVFGLVFIPAVEIEINDYYGAYTGLGLNAWMSLAFVVVLRRRRSTAGQSMYIALSKGIGSLLGVVMSVSLYPYSLVIPVLGATVVTMDAYYAVALYRQFRREGAAPWRLRRPTTAPPATSPVTTDQLSQSRKEGAFAMAAMELWADITRSAPEAAGRALAHARSAAVTTVLLRSDQLAGWEPLERIDVACLADPADAVDPRVGVLVAGSPDELDRVRSAAGRAAVGVRCEISDGAGMNRAADLCGEVDVLVAAFADETNIPLELLLARAQGTKTRVLKEIASGAGAAAVAGVLESGPAGLVVRGDRLADVDEAGELIRARGDLHKDLVRLEVTRTEPVGRGFRGCVDTTSLFGADEGMIVGSTSSGGFLVCAEVHYLPYMNRRPFRVNAGAVHSYVFGAENTAYITDLAAGERTHAVSAGGRFREVVVGRVKVELRPLRLLEARHEDVTVNVFLQDDWHVRVMSDEGEPLNLTTVVPGTGLLGHVAEPGRHVGIKVAERISEF
jgi:3-dehydroquinate synthase II/3-amino-4-hydroxybenzoic acid synthase